MIYSKPYQNHFFFLIPTYYTPLSAAIYQKKFLDKHVYGHIM